MNCRQHDQIFYQCLEAVRCQIVHCCCYCTFPSHTLQRAIGYQQALGLIHSRKAWRSKSHVFLPKCQGQSVPCQTNMENKPKELQLCVKTRGSFEAILAHKPWPHLSPSCYGELDAWTHINTIASNPIFRRSKTQIKDSNQRQGAPLRIILWQQQYSNSNASSVSRGVQRQCSLLMCNKTRNYPALSIA